MEKVRLRAFHSTALGASHIKRNKECQDYSLSYADESCAIAIVCDGHGGDDYVRSAKGAELACRIALKSILRFLKPFVENPVRLHIKHEKHILNLKKYIILVWNRAVRFHHKANPFSEAEMSVLSKAARKRYSDGQIESAYGTTLIAVVCARHFWFGLHIGDGKCVAVNEKGEFRQPIPWDERCFLNATTSLCDEDALQSFRHFYSLSIPRAVFVGTDGVDDSFQNDAQLHKFYATVLSSFAASEWDAALGELDEYLPRLSQKGSGDDISIAAILNMEAIADIPAVMKIAQKEKEDEQKEEEARLEKEKEEENEKQDSGDCLEEIQNSEATNAESQIDESQVGEAQVGEVGESQNGESEVGESKADESQTAELEAANLEVENLEVANLEAPNPQTMNPEIEKGATE